MKCINLRNYFVGFLNVFAVVKDHVRPKFSFHSHTHGETSSKISDMAEHLEPAADMAIEEDPIAESPHDFDEISENRQGITDMAIEVRNGCTEESISKLLDIPTDKIRVAKRSSKPVILLLQLIQQLVYSVLCFIHWHILSASVLQTQRKKLEICS